jgi:PilZ domain
MSRRPNESSNAGSEAGNPSAAVVASLRADLRRQPRFNIEVDITINSRTCGILKGHSVDISESGIAAMLRIEAPLGEVVKLDFALPYGPVTIQAIGRQRNAFRYGFEFLDSNSTNEIIRRTCRDLAVDQSLTWPPALR